MTDDTLADAEPTWLRCKCGEALWRSFDAKNGALVCAGCGQETVITLVPGEPDVINMSKWQVDYE